MYLADGLSAAGLAILIALSAMGVAFLCGYRITRPLSETGRTRRASNPARSLDRIGERVSTLQLLLFEGRDAENDDERQLLAELAAIKTAVAKLRPR